MIRFASGVVLSAGLLGGCVGVVHERHDDRGGATKHPHGGPPGQTGQHPHGGPPGQAKKQVVVVEATHVCIAACEHFFIDGIWYLEVGHKHGDGCGHFLVEGKWGDKEKGPKDKDKKDKDKDKNKKK